MTERSPSLWGAEIDDESSSESRSRCGTPDGVEPRPTFRALYDAHFAYVWRAVANRGVPPAAMDDVVQEVFLVVHRKLGDFEGRSTVRTWLSGIVRRVVSDHVKKRGNQASGQVSLDEHAFQGGEDPAALAERRKAAALVDTLLGKLSETHREVFVMYELEQLTTREIAEVTQTNENTVQTRLKAARKAFQRALDRHRAGIGRDE